LLLLYLGHRSNAVRAYKRTSSEQDIHVSDVLYGTTTGERKVKFQKTKVKEEANEQEQCDLNSSSSEEGKKTKPRNEEEEQPNKARGVTINLNFVLN
jgi:hypothetical protein